jgi:YidC/Oxa1 family membrane protein insertase
VAAAKLGKPYSFTDPATWVAARSKYFVLVLAGADSTFDSCYALRLEDGRLGFAAACRRPAATRDFTLYLGPVDDAELRPLGLGAVAAHGWTRPIELAMLWLLRLLYSLVRNWGVAIVIFSILMKAALWPLSRTQTKQMRQMQLLQPKLNELKTRFKNDAQKLNAETMQLYKLYKINPLSGCLPMVLQLPIFWALYAVLRNTIEMRGAHFVLWLKDLSQADALFGHIPAGIPFIGTYPVGLLPVLMGVSFIGQNMITSTDKKNWAMTIIFPVFITAIFLNLPSGLQLYWFMYNILSIGETLVTVKGGNLWRKKPKKALSPEAN